jgi:hypothetical protein
MKTRTCVLCVVCIVTGFVLCGLPCLANGVRRSRPNNRHRQGPEPLRLPRSVHRLFEDRSCGDPHVPKSRHSYQDLPVRDSRRPVQSIERS